MKTHTVSIRCEHSKGLERSVAGVEGFAIAVTLRELVSVCPECAYQLQMWSPQIIVANETPTEAPS